MPDDIPLADAAGQVAGAPGNRHAWETGTLRWDVFYLRQLAGTTVVVLTTYDSDADILRAVEAAAAGYLLKDTPRAVLADRVRAAANGETVLAPAVAGRLLGRMRAEPVPRTAPLSARETEVLALVARGLTNADIGRRLYLSEATVKTHLLRSCAKLGVSGRTAAVTKAIEIGALPAPGQTEWSQSLPDQRSRPAGPSACSYPRRSATCRPNARNW